MYIVLLHGVLHKGEMPKDAINCKLINFFVIKRANRSYIQHWIPGEMTT